VKKMKKALVCSVGVGSGIERPILLSIEIYSPEIVVLAGTVASREKIEEVCAKCDEIEVVKSFFSNPDDLTKCYKESLKILEELKERGYNYKDIYLNITSGTKVMSAALSLAAVSRGCGSFCYVAGERDENGRVISGTERTLTLKPTTIFAERMLSEAKSYFDRYLYGACEVLCSEVRGLTEEKEIVEKAEFINKINRGYFLWDVFNHKEAFEELKRAAGLSTKKRKKILEKNINFLNKCVKERETEARVGKHLILDLYANALRRGEEGKYDDAVARLYRCLEMLGQWLLWREFGLLHYDVDIDSGLFNEEQRRVLKGWKGREKKLSVGLKKCWLILGMLKRELGKNPIREKGLEAILSVRNNSILAHGSEPVGKEVFEKFERKMREELKREMEDFDSLFKLTEHFKFEKEGGG